MTADGGVGRRPGWLLDEVANAGRENLDRDHVARYDVKEDARASDEVRLCRRLGLTRDSVVVEFGPGTGQFTLAVAPVCARVIAVDVSPAMLAALRSNLAHARLSNVLVVQAGFLTYEHDGPPADLVYSRYALHHLPDFWKAIALSRLASMLRPGGVLRLWDVVYSFDPADAGERLEAWCASADVDAVAGTGDADRWNRADLEEHVRDEHSTFTWLLEPMMLRAGFTIEDATYTDDGIFAQYVLRRRAPISRDRSGR
ncbi:class I SAM-dependent methyltransferase [Jiangella alkaliphila]|nr:class I SAM-dependent methyltransferase [Jiangella alkaliphila]